MAEARSPNRLLGVLFVGVLMGALDIAIIGPALPTLGEAFGVSERSLAWVVTIYVLCNLVGTPWLAKLADRVGRRAIYLASVALFAIGSIAVALAPTFGALVAGRAVQGLGSGGIFPVASAVIGDVFPPERRGRALGLLGAVFGVAFLIGPVVSGSLLLVGWRWLFLVNVPIALGLIVAGARELPATTAREPAPFDRAGMATLGLSLGGLALGLDRLRTDALGASLVSLETGGLLLVSGMLAIGFLEVERRAVDPVLPPALFGSVQTRIAGVLALGAGVFEGGLIFLPGLLVTSVGVSSATAAFMLVPAVVALAVATPLMGRALDAVGSRSVIRAGTGLVGLGLGGISLGADTLVGLYPAMIAVGVGLASLVGAPLRYIMLSEAAETDRATAQGAISMLTRIGLLVGSAGVGSVVDSHGGLAGYQIAYAVIASLAGGLFVGSFGLKRRRRERAAWPRSPSSPR